MNKYKIVGSINIFFGLVQILGSIIIPLFVMNKLTRMYETFEVNLKTPSGMYVVLGIIFVVGIINIFVGIKAFNSKKGNNKVYTTSMVVAIFSIIITPILAGVLVTLVITPIYSLMNQF